MKKPTLVPSGSHFSQYYTLMTCLALPRESTSVQGFTVQSDVGCWSQTCIE